MPRGDKPTTVALALKDGWVYEDALPAMSKEEYDWWYKESLVLDGVRMGPPLRNPTPTQPETLEPCWCREDTEYLRVKARMDHGEFGCRERARYVYCPNCWACGPAYATDEKAIEGWNRSRRAAVAGPRGDAVKWLGYAKTELECHAEWWNQMYQPHFKARAAQALNMASDLDTVIAAATSSPTPADGSETWATISQWCDFCGSKIKHVCTAFLKEDGIAPPERTQVAGEEED